MESAKKLVLVIAGNYPEAREWIKQQPDRNELHYMYVWEVGHILGLSWNTEYVLVGTYESNPVYQSVYFKQTSKFIERKVHNMEDVQPSGMFEDIIAQVKSFNDEHGIENPPVMWNVTYLALALAGEAGELANDIKKIIRDGYSPERLANAKLEVVDIAIYLAMMVEALDMNFEDEFLAKQAELRERYQKFTKKGFGIHANMMKKVGEL